MATIPAPPTFTVGQKLTAALMNTNVRDAVNFLIAPPLCVVTNSAAQSLTNATVTAVTFDTEATDSDNMHSTVTNTSRLVAVTAGWYHVSGHVTFAANATGARVVWIAVNGSTTRLGHGSFTAAPAGTTTSVPVVTTLFLNVGDYAEMYAFQSSGGTLSTDISSGPPRLTAQWVHS